MSSSGIYISQCLGSTGMVYVINEPGYNGTIYKGIIVPLYSSYNSIIPIISIIPL